MICLAESRHLGPCAALLAGLALTLPVTATRAGDRLVVAQADKSEKLDALKQRDSELQAAREAQRQSAEAEAALKREIEQIGADRRKLNEALIDTAAKLRSVESKIAATEARLQPLDANEQVIRRSLEGRRAVIGEVLAALQRIGHRPPPALIASPEDALQSVRTAMVLGAVLPEMRQQVDALAHDLAGLIAVRKQIAEERERLNTEVASLGQERLRMTALIDERQKQEADREKALAAERTRAADLAKQVDNLRI
jgi:septal ring factor EnvC (AmiA/AmiB activator)